MASIRNGEDVVDAECQGPAGDVGLNRIARPPDDTGAAVIDQGVCAGGVEEQAGRRERLSGADKHAVTVACSTGWPAPSINVTGIDANTAVHAPPPMAPSEQACSPATALSVATAAARDDFIPQMRRTDHLSRVTSSQPAAFRP